MKGHQEETEIFLSEVKGLYTLCNNPFEHLFEQVTDRKINGKTLVIRYLSSTPSHSDLKRCHVIFLSRTLGHRTFSIIKAASDHPILTISDINGFIDMGGMIEFKIENRRMRFMVNLGRARLAGINFRAQMLELATEVIGLKSRHDAGISSIGGPGQEKSGQPLEIQYD